MKTKNILLIFMMGIFIFIPKNVVAQEISPMYYTYETFEYDWTWNYKQAAYYYIVDLSSNFVTAVNEAAANWFSTGHHTNPLYPMTRTYTKSNSPMDFYNKSLSENELGVTNMFVKGGASAQPYYAAEPDRDWLYCTIYIDESQASSLSSTKKKVLMLHEMGHCFGLAHASSTARLMYPYLSVTTATNVTYHDSAALVEKLS